MFSWLSWGSFHKPAITVAKLAPRCPKAVAFGAMRWQAPLTSVANGNGFVEQGNSTEHCFILDLSVASTGKPGAKVT
jgi:hypothetical protein